MRPANIFLFCLAAVFSIAVRGYGFWESLLLRWIVDIIVTRDPNWVCGATIEVDDQRFEHALTRDLDAPHYRPMQA